MRTGTDRSAPGIAGGTRHPCPFCAWYLDAPPVSAEALRNPRTSIMDLISYRLGEINRTVQEHVYEQHPDEYAESTPLRLDISG